MTQQSSEPTFQPVPTLPGWLWRPTWIVFISSGCSMVLELVAGRIIAPYVGVSLYTWTTVIGVVLSGISMGNYLGGRLADRWASPRLLGFVLLLGGLSCFCVLAVDATGSYLPGNWPVVVQILVLTAALFLLPSALLGGISPVVAKLAVQDLARTGSTVGKIYAAGAVGSIVGTFATGYVLIALFGTHAVVWGVAVVLIGMGLLFYLANRKLALGGIVLVVAGAGVIWLLGQSRLRGICTLETNYFCIRVHDEDQGGEPVRVLVLDRLVHSYSSPSDPKRLVYGYEQVYAGVIGQRAQTDDHLRALFIGGGGYTFPRYMEATYPNSDLDVVEIDPAVTRTAYDQLGLSHNTRIVSYNEDARLFLNRPPTKAYDLILGDAFNDYSVPYHLTTREFNQRVRAWLAPDGLYMVNMIDGVRRDFLRAFIYTLQQTFRHVYVIPAHALWLSSPRMTYVLVATDTLLDLSAIQSPGDAESPGPSLVLSDETVKALLSEGRAVLLTDQYAPVEQMLAPVFRGETASH
jgi:spermidine synthase